MLTQFPLCQDSHPGSDLYHPVLFPVSFSVQFIVTNASSTKKLGFVKELRMMGEAQEASSIPGAPELTLSNAIISRALCLLHMPVKKRSSSETRNDLSEKYQ